MPSLYLNLIEAHDNMLTLGRPVAAVYQGTAAQVTKMCEALTKAIDMLGFEIGGPA